jgi:hypothetical protein
MATLGIESNGRLEKTAIYINGEQIGGLKELFLNLDEEGTFDAVLQYEGSDKVLYTKNVFEDYLNNIKIVEPSFTEEEAESLQLLVVESEGDIDTCAVYINDEMQEGIVSLLVHIKGVQTKSSGISGFFGKKEVIDGPVFKADITYRNDDDSIETQGIF